MDKKITCNDILQKTTVILIKPIALLLLFLGITLPGVQVQANAGANIPSPPYIARTTNSMMVMFHLKAEEVQPFLPDNVKAKSNEKGLVTGGLEMYTTEQAHGVPNYSLVFFFVEVNGPETNYGNSGNWALWGKINNEAALNAFKIFYNYPYSINKSMTVERKDNEAIASVHENNGEGFSLAMKVRADKPFTGEGVANSYSQLSGGRIVQTQIPWLVDGNEAEVVSFDVNAGGNKTLTLLRGVKPFFGVASKNVFSYAAPIVTK